MVNPGIVVILSLRIAGAMTPTSLCVTVSKKTWFLPSVIDSSIAQWMEKNEVRHKKFKKVKEMERKGIERRKEE